MRLFKVSCTQWAIFLVCLSFGLTAALATLPALAKSKGPDPTPDMALESVSSLSFECTPSAACRQGPLLLQLKHFVNSGKTPILLIPGLAQNDRFFDSLETQFSFARFLYDQGYDVWIGNTRGTGTEGFRSQSPRLNENFTIDHLAAFDLPALVQTVVQKTGKRPFIVGHSLAAWMLDGYFSGLTINEHGKRLSQISLGLERQKLVQGVITLSGVYNLKWENPFSKWKSQPVRTERDYYRSNYELELLSQVQPVYWMTGLYEGIRFNWVSDILEFPINRLPFIGAELEKAYGHFQSELAKTPLLSMFYYAPNSDPEMVKKHGQDSLEMIPSRFLFQLGQTVLNGYTQVFEPGEKSGSEQYADQRKYIKVPYLFIGAGYDRLASQLQVRESGFNAMGSTDKTLIEVEKFGHLDIATGIAARNEVWEPIVQWIQARQ